MNSTYRRGDIFYADLGHVIGSEQGGDRPVVIIQNDTGNRRSPTVIIAPFTTKGDRKPELPTHCLFENAEGLENPSTALLEQIRTIDKQRLGRKIGHLSDEQMLAIEQGILISLGFIKPKVEPLEICLCKKCLDSFNQAGAYRIRRKSMHQKVFETCTYCKYRMGYDYIILPRKIIYPKMKLVDIGVSDTKPDNKEKR